MSDKKIKTKPKVETKEVQVIPQEQAAEALISQAIKEKVPVETMERILAMRRELKAENAKEEYDRAMAEFQANCPIISKNKKVLNKDKTTTRYSYAPLDDIVKQVRPILKENGFSYTINTKVEPDWVTAICKITHQFGHSGESEFKVPIDKEGYMSSPQKFASALTFAKRYAFCNAFGILTGDEDDDASSAGTSETPEQKFERAKTLLTSLNDVDKLVNYAQNILPKSTFTKEQKEDLDSLIKTKVDNLMV